jgi:hypothetical protein
LLPIPYRRRGSAMAIEFVPCKACAVLNLSDQTICVSCGADISTGVVPPEIHRESESSGKPPLVEQDAVTTAASHQDKPLFGRMDRSTVGVIVISLIVGFFIGREQLKYELRSTMRTAFSGVGESLQDIFGKSKERTGTSVPIKKSASPKKPSPITIDVEQSLKEVLQSDPRNSGIKMNARYGKYIIPSTLVINIKDVSDDKSMSDVFRVLLHYSAKIKEKQFKTIELTSRGKTKFVLKGDYFKKLGEEFGSQNVVYTVRTFPENVYKLDGTRAFISLMVLEHLRNGLDNFWEL